jgi:hypothetical protein
MVRAIPLGKYPPGKPWISRRTVPLPWQSPHLLRRRCRRSGVEGQSKPKLPIIRRGDCYFGAVRLEMPCGCQRPT